MTKKIVDGKRYDTEKSAVIGSYANSYNTRDFNQFEETLYRTSKGSYFLVGSGGPMSKYSRSNGDNSWSGSSDNFTPLTNAEALEWCQDHEIRASVIEKEFSSLIEDA